ncbi:MAG: hypothetical protein BroJett030_26120 [Alphaproteobacteria bacterium]|nr:MAG: hypothetical protein BroJett030_26120 [Alphaproteobacteria bacterium]
MRRLFCAAMVLMTVLIRPATAEAPSDLRGIWSPDLACAEASPRHVIGADTLEWRDGNRQVLRASVVFIIQADRIGVRIVSVEPAGAPLAVGDVVQYRRVPGGIRPLIIERGDTMTDIADKRVFYRCSR